MLLSEVVPYCRVKRVGRGAGVIRPGTRMSHLYLALEGCLSMVAEEPEGDVLLDLYTAGDVIGAEGYFVPGLVYDRLVATDASQIAEISYKRLRSLMATTFSASADSIVMELGTAVSRRMCKAANRIKCLALKDGSSRILDALKDLAELRGQVDPRGVRVRTSHLEITQIVGCAREVVGRNLKKLADRGEVVVEKREIILLNK